MQVVSGPGVEKKKPAEQLRPVSFRNIPAMEPVVAREKKADPAGALVPGSQVQGAKLMIEMDEKETPKTGKKTAPEQGASGSLSSLSKIRQQVAGLAQNKDAVVSRSLEVEPLHQAWQQYADYLRENKNPAVQSLELATLRIVDAQTFEVSAHNNLEQRFIEQEKRGLSDHLQQAFANKAINFTVVVAERAETEVTGERPLNKREQFMQIVDQYPLVKELKDRLRLELDY
jgi:DNA polymerase-3 subunit gamma/tau